MKYMPIFLLALAGCGGSGTSTPIQPAFSQPELKNGLYRGSTNATSFGKPSIPLTVEIETSQITYTIDGYPAIVCPRDWVCYPTFEGEPATITLEAFGNGYKGHVYREGFGWPNRVQSHWRSFEVQ